jgi:outer membrane protein with beta-barrel domain
MRIVLAGALAAALLTLTAVPARADGFITPYIGYNFGGDSTNCTSLTNCEEKRTNWGVTIGATHGIFGFQEDIGYAPDFFGKTPGSENAVLHFMSDLMILVPAGPIQPYGFIGIGVIHPHASFDLSSLASVSKNALGHDLGGGLNIFFTHGVGVHGEVRHLRTFKDFTFPGFSSDKLDFWRASAGMTFRF